MPWIPSARSRLGRALQPTWQYAPQLARTLASVPAGARICDLGAGGRRVRPDALTVDLCAGPDTDVTADLHALPLEDGRFDLVICTGTLNLCVDPPRVLREAHRVLAPGGLLHLETGMYQPYNPEPDDYWRWTLAGLRRLTREAGFEETRAGTHIGPFTALAANGMALAGALFPGRSVGRRAVRAASHALLGPLKYLDATLPEGLEAPFAYGLYYVGRRVG